MTLRARLAALIALAVAVAVGVQALLGYFEFRQALTEDLDRDLGQFTARVAAQIVPGSEDWSGVNAAVEDYVARARLRVGNRVVASFGGRFPEGISPQQNAPHSLGAWRATSLALPGYATGARLDVVISSRDFEESLKRYRQVALLNGAVFAALGALVAVALARGALAPLEALVEATRRVAQSGNLSARVVARGRGELPTLAASFNAMLERLEGFRRREAEFANNASHELRTPITAMMLSLGAHREGLQGAAETLDELENELRRMRALSESLLLLAREGRAARQPFDLAQLVRKAAAPYGVAYSGLERLGFVGDAALLRRAVENLLENAAKYAPGAPVIVSLERDAGGVRLEVTDEGAGMMGTLLGRAAQPFERGPSREPGVGLGLSVVRRVAEAHGGALELENLAPRGFRARIRLPFREPMSRAGAPTEQAFPE